MAKPRISSRQLHHLHPLMLEKVHLWLKECKREGVKVKIYQTYRNDAQQDYLYSKGRTRQGNIVTWARGGQSLHNYVEDGLPASQAIDFYIENEKGGADWDSISEYTKAGRIATRLGLVWGGDWNRPKKDYVHIQLF